MTIIAGEFNPFPGLRPFGPEEDHLFFGREQVVDQLLMRLRERRFLGVIGSSGCGKSSLVRAGLIPSLHSGFMTSAGSSWRIAVMRPGTDPIGNLADALNKPDILGCQVGIEEETPILTEVTLRRSNLGLVECVRLARLPREDNLLIVVDQFEELFRFKRSGQSEGARDEAVAFVKRLLSASSQRELPVYIVVTMRSDFIGECHEYPGLTEAINEGQFLIPRLTREQLRSAISGPILVAGGEIAPRLLVRLLNDVGDDPEELPILQHALMRTWNYWRENRVNGEPIDVHHYEAIGALDSALSSHADEAFDELDSVEAKERAARIFKALTDTSSDTRGVRRPTTVEQLCLIADASPEQVASVVDKFRLPGRSFLMPPIDVPLTPDTFVDISHESLMRVWDRLIAWARGERASAETYLRAARAAARYEEGTADLWRDPGLSIFLNWRDEVKPSEAWAARYHPDFKRTMDFIDKSEKKRDLLEAEERKARRRKLQTAWGVSVVVSIFGVFAYVQQQRAEQQQLRAEQNFQLAVRAVDEMLTDVAVEESLADIPQTEELRQQLLEKARMFLEALREDPAADPGLRLQTALARMRLGKIYQYQGKRQEAEAALGEAISQLRGLHLEFDNEPTFQLRFGEAYNELGEQLRPYDYSGAEAAYDNAVELQKNLIEVYPDNPDYNFELARTYNNLGILLSTQSQRADEAEESFQDAIALFDMLREVRNYPLDDFRLARTKNNLAIFLRNHGRQTESVSVYGEAIELMGGLIDSDTTNREYREGLAIMYNNLGNVHLMRSDRQLALEANTAARQLFESLAMPAHSLRNEIANNHNTRGRILADLGRSDEAARAYEASLRHFEQLEQDYPNFSQDPSLNGRYGNALANVAIMRAKQEHYGEAVELVSRAIEYHKTAADSPASSATYKNSLANAYWLLADTYLKSRNYADAIDATEILAELATEENAIYEAAVLYSRGTQLLMDDPTLTAAQRNSIGETYMERTVSLLRTAIAAGYALERIEADMDLKFSHVRKREDFRRLLSNARRTKEQ